MVIQDSSYWIPSLNHNPELNGKRFLGFIPHSTDGDLWNGASKFIIPLKEALTLTVWPLFVSSKFMKTATFGGEWVYQGYLLGLENNSASFKTIYVPVIVVDFCFVLGGFTINHHFSVRMRHNCNNFAFMRHRGVICQDAAKINFHGERVLKSVQVMSTPRPPIDIRWTTNKTNVQHDKSPYLRPLSMMSGLGSAFLFPIFVCPAISTQERLKHPDCLRHLKAGR